MSRRQPINPGELVYLSRRRLYDGSAQAEVDTTVRTSDSETAKEAGLHLGEPGLGEVSAGIGTRGGRTDPGWEEQVRERHLRQLLERMGELPNLERNEGIHEGGWFRFHRRVRFAVAHADDHPSIKALIVVDAEEVRPPSQRPGLLLNGSIAHVLDPYASDELRAAPGSRSGSGTDRLFIWLEELRRAWEDDPEAPLRTVLDRSEPGDRDPTTAWEMYGAFAESPRTALVALGPLIHEATCEGVAQASMIATPEEMTLVMGNPLFIRRREPPREPPPRRRGFSRLLRR